MTYYNELVKALRCKSLSKECDSCGYGYHLSPDSECNDACHFEQIVEDAAAAIEELQARLGEAENSVERWKDMYLTKHEQKQAEWVGIEYDGYADGYPVYDLWECSVCGEEHNGEADTLSNYCPNCGAKMEVQDG